MSLLVVEDDEHVAGVLVPALTDRGFDVVWESGAHAALDALGPDTAMVVLDVALPDMDGFELCMRIRHLSDAPVIMTTSGSEVADRIHGLRLGADDFLVKPYDLRELIARIDAVRRRCRAGWHQGCGDTLVRAAGDVSIDLAAREVAVGRTTVRLTKKEFDLLALLAAHRDVAVPRERILQEVWETTWKGLGRSLEVHVASIRRKLPSSDTIETVRGVGYRLVSQ